MSYGMVVERLRTLVPPNKTSVKSKRGVETRIYRDDDGTIRVRYHQTDVVTLQPDGTIVLNNGGYYSMTTKERISEYLSPYLAVFQKKGKWYVWKDNKEIPYENGMTFNETVS